VGSYLRSTNKVRYALTDHLGNTRVTFTADEYGVITVQEAHDYYPHGGLLPGRQLNGTASSPLAYQGQEYDPEVGLTAFNTVSQFVMARSRHTAHRAKRIVSRACTTSKWYKSSPALGLS